jgi:hypothetical protein
MSISWNYSLFLLLHACNQGAEEQQNKNTLSYEMTSQMPLPPKLSIL